MKSCLYIGDVRHRRYTPVGNEFNYGLFMVYLDLAELPKLFDPYWLWSARRKALAYFDRRDHLKHHPGSLDTVIRNLVEKKTGSRPVGPIRLLTHLRYFGYCFNPVSFYYVFDADDQKVETIVAEVNNTPWGEQHLYILDEEDNVAKNAGRFRFRFNKDFHVSPFLPMEMGYDWRFSTPSSRLAIHMENHKDGALHFDATMTMRREEINSLNLAKVLMRFPFMTGRVIALIYWQALKLWWKKCRFYPHPQTVTKNPESALS